MEEKKTSTFQVAVARDEIAKIEKESVPDYNKMQMACITYLSVKNWPEVGSIALEKQLTSMKIMITQ